MMVMLMLDFASNVFKICRSQCIQFYFKTANGTYFVFLYILDCNNRYAALDTEAIGWSFCFDRFTSQLIFSYFLILYFDTLFSVNRLKSNSVSKIGSIFFVFFYAN